MESIPRSLSNPKLASFASYLAERFGCSRVVDAGVPNECVDPDTLRHAIVYGDWPAADPEAQSRLVERLTAWLLEAPAGLVVASSSVENSVEPLGKLLERQGFHVDFEGTLKEADTCDPKALVILAGRNSAPPSAAPSGFRVVAFVNAYNEADVIAPSL